MESDISTIKYSSPNHLSNEKSSEILDDSEISSTFESNNDDCDEYEKFLEEMDELHSKVIGGDLSDFEEFED